MGVYLPLLLLVAFTSASDDPPHTPLTLAAHHLEALASLAGSSLLSSPSLTSSTSSSSTFTYLDRVRVPRHKEVLDAATGQPKRVSFTTLEVQERPVVVATHEHLLLDVDGVQVNATVTCNPQRFCAVTSLTCAAGSAPAALWTPDDSGDDRHAASGKQAEHLSVLSANIWNWNHFERRHELLQAELRRLRPGVVGFQEVRARRLARRRGGFYQVEALSLMLPRYQYVSAPAMMFNEGNELHAEGLAVFSRFPILSARTVKLSRDESDEGDFHQRICLVVLVDSPVGPVYVLNTHLSLSLKARRRTMKEIHDVVQSLEHPAVLLGDLNHRAHEAGNRLVEEYGYRDVWTHLHGGSHTRASWTFSSWQPHARIDYVLLPPSELEPVLATVEGKRHENVKGLAPAGGVPNLKGRLFPSDHFFLHAVLARRQSYKTEL